MKKLKPFLLLFLAAIMFAPGLYAQEDDTDSDADTSTDKYKNIKKKDQEKMDQYLDGSVLFPPKPKSNWSLGVKVGHAAIIGDIKTRSGGAIALDIRKGLGHAFSLRMQINGQRVQGMEWRTRLGYRNPNVPGGETGNPWKNAGYTEGVYKNYFFQAADVNLQAVINLNNINFYKEQSKWNAYFAAGAGVMGYLSKVNALDDNDNRYPFNEIITPQAPGDRGFTISDQRTVRREIWDQLDNMMGSLTDKNNYESYAEGHLDKKGIYLGDDYYVVHPILTAALGLRYRLSRRFELEGEYRLGFVADDLMDGVRWSEQGDFTRDFDNLSQISLGLHIRIGKSEEADWWRNPLTEVYKQTAETRNMVKRLTDDTDKDGVPDLYDKEPDTPEGMMVDAAGRTLDSDGDGVPDNNDDEPFSPKNAAVDERGVALDEDSDGVPDIFDKEPGSAAGVLVDAKGITINNMDKEKILQMIKENSGGGGLGGDCLLPMIHFDLDRARIKPEFFPELYYIAQVMKANPSVSVVAVGHTDVRASDSYNDDLSRRRVETAVDFLVNTYGIARSRFSTSFEGERNNIIPELPPNRSNSRLEPLHYMNRRVEFRCQ